MAQQRIHGCVPPTPQKPGCVTALTVVTPSACRPSQNRLRDATRVSDLAGAAGRLAARAGGTNTVKTSIQPALPISSIHLRHGQVDATPLPRGRQPRMHRSGYKNSSIMEVVVPAIAELELDSPSVVRYENRVEIASRIAQAR